MANSVSFSPKGNDFTFSEFNPNLSQLSNSMNTNNMLSGQMQPPSNQMQSGQMQPGQMQSGIDQSVINFQSPNDKEYGFLSNYYDKPFVIDNTTWPTVVHYVQAMKFITGSNDSSNAQTYANLIRNQPTPAKAMSMGEQRSKSKKGDKFNNEIKYYLENGVRPRPDWNQIRNQIMEYALQQKFTDSELRQKLINTNPALLINSIPYDYYWGAGAKRNGENHLGRILMKLRSTYLGQPVYDILTIPPIPPPSFNKTDQGCLPGFPGGPCPPSPYVGKPAYAEDWSVNFSPQCMYIPGSKPLICVPDRNLHVEVIPQFLTFENCGHIWKHILTEVSLKVEPSSTIINTSSFVASMSDQCDLVNGLSGYGYCQSWNQMMLILRNLVQQKVGQYMNINTAQIRYYNSPDQKLNYRMDDRREVSSQYGMAAVLTLCPYYPRRVIFKESTKTKLGKTPQKWTFMPSHGSLYIMYGNTNNILEYGSPAVTKTEQNNFNYNTQFMQRISITFRELHM